MSRITAPPFRLSRMERVQAGPWLLGPTGKLMPNPESIEHWDYATTLVIERELTIDVEGVRRDTGLAATVPLIAGIRWHSGWTNLRGVTGMTSVTPSMTIRGAVSGELLGGWLRLEAFLAL